MWKAIETNLHAHEQTHTHAHNNLAVNAESSITITIHCAALMRSVNRCAVVDEKELLLLK